MRLFNFKPFKKWAVFSLLFPLFQGGWCSAEAQESGRLVSNGADIRIYNFRLDLGQKEELCNQELTALILADSSQEVLCISQIEVLVEAASSEANQIRNSSESLGEQWKNFWDLQNPETACCRCVLMGTTMCAGGCSGCNQDTLGECHE